MASLRRTSFELKGGCFCSAVRYTVSVPELSARTKLPEIGTEILLCPQDEVSKRLPLIVLDHCTSCRRVPGSIIEAWIIMPDSWMQFSLLQVASSDTASKASESDETRTEKRITPATIDVLTGEKELLKSTHLRYFSSSETANRVFCGRCGTHLTLKFTGPAAGMAKDAIDAGIAWKPHFDLAVGTLDKESLEMEGFRPTVQCWYNDGIGWVQKLLK